MRLNADIFYIAAEHVDFQKPIMQQNEGLFKIFVTLHQFMINRVTQEIENQNFQDDFSKPFSALVRPVSSHRGPKRENTQYVDQMITLA